ncbi:MAG: hypothetical protein F6K18_30975 [Okeania sp. SIO2C2]|uniref:hypothetical protein n=1 Tax=unclassified Okeania TaxID=2634635 RepID=UPI0013BBBA01|nr:MULTISPECIES: hypothetical protein [unclassified Okeania]NEP90877.1 hypothetical protein [Okeania sp. SIO2C2]NES89651.1 hypothetical protein [Okeania sp. SIO2B9]
MLVWNFVKRLAVKIGKTIAQVKHELLSDYLLQDLKKPTIKFRAIFHLIDVFYRVLTMVIVLTRSRLIFQC